MNLTKAQLQAIGHLTAKRGGNTQSFIVFREKITKVSQPFVSGVVAIDGSGAVEGIEPINGRVIDALVKKGLIELCSSDVVNGDLYKATEALLSNASLLLKCASSFGEAAI